MATRKGTSKRASTTQVQILLITSTPSSFHRTHKSKKRIPTLNIHVQEPDEEMFTSGSTFNFEAAVPSPRMTRARRASMNFDVVSFTSSFLFFRISDP